MPFPDIDPIAIQIGPLVIRWYALAYITGLVLGWRYCLRLTARPPQGVTREQIDDFLLWATLGVVLGGRLGYVAFYQPGYFIANPIEIPQMWKGGMSFHGGLLGVMVAMLLYARRHGLALLNLTDIVTAGAPIGIFFGRIANFINGELWGRTTDVPWGVVFPRAGPLPRHPSQLYEAALEGLLLFILLATTVYAWRGLARPGLVSGLFMAGYAVARMAIEVVRQPDVQIGFLAGGSTMGQWLSIPLLVFGLYLVQRALRRTPVGSP